MTPFSQTARKGQPAANSKLGVFISYSRRDMAAADALVLELEAAGFAVSIDRRDLAYGEEWQRELAEFIRASDTVLWLVSPDSVTSKWCNWELGEVARLHKRLLPVRLHPTDNATLPPALGKIHILPVEGVYDPALHLSDVVATLNTDQAWLKEGTHLAARAWQWLGGAEANASAVKRDNSALLTGAQLKRAQAWHLRQPANAPAPSAAVLELILASGDAARRRQRLISVIAVAVMALAAALWSQYELATQRQETALLNESRTLTGLAQQSAVDGDGVSAMLLAMAALPDAAEGARRPHLPDAERALYAAMLDQHETRIFNEASDPSLFIQPNAQEDRVATLSDTNVLRLYDLNSATAPQPIPGSPGAILGAFWSPDGQWMVSTSVKIGDEAPQALLWNLRLGREVAALKGQTADVSDVAFNPDGQIVATVAQDGVARIYTMEGKLLKTHPDPLLRYLHGVAFSRDGRTLAFGNSDGMVRLWNWRSGRVKELPSKHRFEIARIVFAADGQKLITVGTDRTVRSHSLNGRVASTVAEGHDDITLSTSVSPDGSKLLTGSQDKTARLWDARRGSAIQPALKGHLGSVTGVAFSPDGALALSAAKDDTTRLWRVATDASETTELAVLKGHAGLAAAAFTSNGQWVASVGGGSLRLWRVRSSKQRDELTGHGGWVNGAVFSPDGQLLVSYAEDRAARLWQVATGKLVRELGGHRSGVKVAAFFNGGAALITVAADGSVRQWNGRTGAELGTPLKGPENRDGPVFLSPNAQRLLIPQGKKPATLWDLNKGTAVASLQGPAARKRYEEAAFAAFSPDGLLLATVASHETSSDGKGGITFANDRVATLWNAQTGLRIGDIDGGGDSIERLAFDARGSRVALALRGGAVQIASLAEPQRRISFSAKLSGQADTRWRGLAFSADGARLVTSSRGSGQIWDATSGKLLATLGDAGQPIGPARFTPDGWRIVSHEGNTARLWDARTGVLVAVLAGHRHSIRGLAISPAGDRLATASTDTGVRLWPLYASTDALLQQAKQAAPRCLSRAEREAANLSGELPCWCGQLGKWVAAGASQAGPIAASKACKASS